MKTQNLPTCNYCSDPLKVSLKPELEVLRLTGTIAVFKCPQCSGLILDDLTGWKGSGIVFHATVEMIADYAKRNGATETAMAKLETLKDRSVDSTAPSRTDAAG